MDQPPLRIHPAYGRQYTTPTAALDDWISGRDFKVFGGRYCSVRDRLAIASDGWPGITIIQIDRDKSQGALVVIEELVSIPLPTKSCAVGHTTKPSFAAYG